MDNLDFMGEEIKSRGNIIESDEEKPLAWKRLYDANDDYDSFLVDPKREFKPGLDR